MSRGGRTMTQDDNPFKVTDVEDNIKKELAKEGFVYQREYTIMIVPNIVDISYGSRCRIHIYRT